MQEKHISVVFVVDDEPLLFKLGEIDFSAGQEQQALSRSATSVHKIVTSQPPRHG